MPTGIRYVKTHPKILEQGRAIDARKSGMYPSFTISGSLQQAIAKFQRI